MNVECMIKTMGLGYLRKNKNQYNLLVIILNFILHDR